MIANNPEPEPKPLAKSSKGNGELAHEYTQSRHIRATARDLINIMQHHSARQVPISDEVAGAIQAVVAKLMVDPNYRLKGLGAKLALSALNYNLKLFEAADKMSRLDNGESTENRDIRVEVEHVKYVAARDG